MDEWLRICFGLIQGFSVEYEVCDGQNQSTMAALLWLRREYVKCVPENVGETMEAEFQLALAVEFMRSSYRQDIPAPKRVLGLIAACEALRKSEESFGSFA
jgi:hypothetical protein